MEFENIIRRALEIRARYGEYEKEKFRREWTGPEILQGFVGDVGDLSKLVLAKEGVRDIQDVDAKLAHELSDCLWSIIVLADKYTVDLEQSFLKTMDELDRRLDG